jgi:DNA-binding protein YbaB
MTNPIDPSGIDRMLTDALSALTTFQASQQDGAVAAEGIGEAADGMITVRTGPPGRVTGLTLNPRVLRLGTEALAEEITSAVNQALTDLQESAGTSAGPVDLSALGEQLKRTQETAARQLTSFLNALAAAQDRLGSPER